MANILLTNICNQGCSYCFAKNFNNNTSADKGKNFQNFKKILDFLEASGEKNARFMGGEPTLHYEFQKIVDYTLKRSFKIHIFTNGKFSDKITNFLRSKKKLIKYSFNINHPSEYSLRDWKLIKENFITLSRFNNCVIGTVIWQIDFDIDYLVKLAKRNPVKSIVLRIANPIFGKKNSYLPLSKHYLFTKKLLDIIEKADRNNIKLGLGCGFAKKMFTSAEIKRLDEHNEEIKWGCTGNSGRFDIDLDLSITRCFPLSGWKKLKLSRFKNSNEIEEYFKGVMGGCQKKNLSHDFIKKGPCFSHLLKKP